MYAALEPIAERLRARLVRAMADADQTAFHHDQEGRKAMSLLNAGRSLAFEQVMSWIADIERDAKEAQALAATCQHGSVFQKGDTFLRVHDPDSSGAWGTDLFSRDDGQGVGIMNWPTTLEHLLKLMDILGCVRKCSLCQGVHEDGDCAACGRKLAAIPVGG